jgi:hypothetical protein
MSFATLMTEHNMLHEKHTALRAAVDTYHKASNNVQSYVTYYLTNGGDPTVMPAQWTELDNLRQEAYLHMLRTAGLIT